MSRRQHLRAQARRRPARSALAGWTIQRASVIGAASALAALLIAGLAGTGGPILLHSYAALLGLAAFGGASVLWITASDMRRRGTSGRMRPIRGFDAAVGAVLLIPSLYALSLVWRDLGL